MNTPTPDKISATHEAQFLAPETHQRAAGKSEDASYIEAKIVRLLPQYKGGLTMRRLADNMGDPERVGYLIDSARVAAAVERLIAVGAVRQVGHRLLTSAQVASDARREGGFKVEASTRDPSTRDPKRHPLVAEHIATTRKEASARARFYLQRGYWVEVFDNSSKELLAGPFDPDQRFPTYIV